MTVDFSDIKFYRTKLVSKLENNPVVKFYKTSKKEDSVELRSFCQVENERLEKLYGIKSTIKNPELLKKISSSLEDFCNINENNNLFRGLEINEKPLHSIYNFNEKNMQLTFNSACSWNKLSDYTKRQFDSAEIGSDNPKYFFYKAFGEVLNYNYIPDDYRTIEADVQDIVALRMMRFCNPKIHFIEPDSKEVSLTNDNINDFKASYIATRMSGEYLPKMFNNYFGQVYGNTSLKFPSAQSPLKIEEGKKKFGSIKEAQNYLLNEYKIKSRFDNIEYANACVSAVEELTQAVGDKSIFNGLEIITTNKLFNDRDKNSHAFTTPDGKIYLRKKDKFAVSKAIMQEVFDSGNGSANTTKNNIFIHELSHYLDYKGENSNDEIIEKKMSLNDTGKRITGRVSSYAATDLYEFCAEYISGRMAGNKYPEITNKIFEQWWKGPKINFPQ